MLFLNIGGISNLTYWDGVSLIGLILDLGALMDDFMTSKLNERYDKDGILLPKVLH